MRYNNLSKKIARIKSAGKGAAIEKSQAVIGSKRINESVTCVQSLSCTRILLVSRGWG